MKIISGEYKGRSLKTTTGPGLRPAMAKVREALFSMLEARGVIWAQTNVLDLYAGTGSLGFEALSRGASQVTFVEKAPYAAKTIMANADLLGVEGHRVNVVQQDVAQFLIKGKARPYSLVFIDPPYQLNTLTKTVHQLIKYNWLAENAIVNAEVEARLKIQPETLHEQLELLDDRAYGQTRVVLWTAKA